MKGNIKLIKLVILLVTLLILLSTFVYAKPFTEAFIGALTIIHDFFVQEQYKPFAKVIDFFVFLFLFIFVYMKGAQFAFKEVKRPEQGIVIVLGIVTAFLLVVADVSISGLLPFINWIFYILSFILSWIMLKNVRNSVLRFILALLITLASIIAFQFLFSYLTGDVEFYKSFIELFTGLGWLVYLVIFVLAFIFWWWFWG